MHVFVFPLFAHFFFFADFVCVFFSSQFYLLVSSSFGEKGKRERCENKAEAMLRLNSVVAFLFMRILPTIHSN